MTPEERITEYSETIGSVEPLTVETLTRQHQWFKAKYDRMGEKWRIYYQDEIAKYRHEGFVLTSEYIALEDLKAMSMGEICELLYGIDED